MTLKISTGKIAAVILVSVFFASLAKSFDPSIIARMDSMSPTDYVEHQRKLLSHSLPLKCLTWILGGGCYTASVEVVSLGIGLWGKKISTSKPSP